MSVNEPPRFLTVPETAKILRLHEMTIYRMLKKGQIPRARVGGRWRIPADVCDRILKGENAHTR